MTPEELARLKRKIARREAVQKGAAFEKSIISLARTLGWRVAKIDKMLDPRTKQWRTPMGADGKGFPDLTMAKRGRVVFVELKAGGSLEKDQRLWRDAIRGPDGSGVEWYLWTPADWEAARLVLQGTRTNT